MRTIYTSMSTAEVHDAIHKAANIGGTEFLFMRWAGMLENLQNVCESHDEAIKEYLKVVSSAIGTVPWKSFIKFKVGIITKTLTSHENKAIKAQAISVLCMLRSKFAAFKAESRK